MKVLVYGASGWIGGKMLTLLRDRKELEVTVGKSRLEEYASVKREIDEISPSHILLTAGLTGRPNVDWCESHWDEVLRINVIATSVLADYCHQRRIHLTYFGTGCIYEYDDSHPLGSGIGFKEEDEPNFEQSFYSKSKILTEKILKNYDNVLTLRIRMPLSDDLHPRNFITKITQYEKVVDIPNSMTVLTELLPIACDMLMRSKTGIYNFTNPGVISHNQILDLYTSTIDPQFKYQNFELEEQAKILKAGRSNNELVVCKLMEEYPMDDIQTAVIKLFERMRNIECMRKMEK